jgi:WD40 repeat protein
MWFSQYQRISPIKEPEISQSLPFSESYGVIGVERLNDLEEVILLASGEQPVLALSQREEGALLSVNSAGWLTEWCWEVGDGWIVCDEMDFEYARSGWVNFSDDGSFVILPKGYDGEEISGFMIWDTIELRIVDQSPEWEGYATTGSYLSPSGEISVDFMKGRKFIVANWADPFPYNDDLFNYVKEEYPVIGKVVIDPEEELLAIAFETGQVSIGDIEEGNYLSNTRQYYLLEEGETTEIQDFQFNPTRTRLAWLSGERLVVIRLQNLIFRIGIDTPVNDGRFLTFDRTGRILVVATGDELLLFDVIKNKQIAVYPVNQEITSLFFTQDNRLLVWGDADGNVHLWGVPLE